MTEERTILYRSAFELRAEGRTLEGLAIPFDLPALVTDPGAAPYWEAHSPNAFTRSLDNHKATPFPVFANHSWKRGGMPIGSVTFARSAEGLVYVAPLLRTRAADEALEMIDAKVANDVSLGFEPLKTRTSNVGGRAGVRYRTESALYELSLAPTGFGQYPQAKVDAVRSLEGNDEEQGEEGTPRLDAVSKLLAEWPRPRLP